MAFAYNRLVDEIGGRLSRLRDASEVTREVRDSWLDEPLPLSPWDIWMLLCLIRHRDRQQFVAETVAYRLQGDHNALAAMGAMGHPERPQQGIVPGLLDWEYYFHGRGCCLTHRVSGESIDVDFYDASADWIDDLFFIYYLRSLSAPEFVEARVLELHPSPETVVLAFDRLLDAGLLEMYPEHKVVRLAFPHERLAELLTSLEPRWKEIPTVQAVASALGDWLLLESLPDAPQEAVMANAAALRSERSRLLVAEFRGGPRRSEALEALVDLGSPDRDTVLRAALEELPSGTVSTALEIAEKVPDNRWCPHVAALLHRTDPNGEIPAPHVWVKAAEILLQRGMRPDLRKRLLANRSHCLGEAAVLALEYFPDVALQVFRHALRSPIPCNRATAASVLAILDTEWSRAELAAVLAESQDQAATAECRSALRETHALECHECVRDWELRNPHEPETGSWISMGEVFLRKSDSWIRWEMSIWHDRVLPLRANVPPRPKSRWWPWG